MGSLTRLNGFKVLKEVAALRLLFTREGACSPADLFKAAAGEKINLPYVTLARDGPCWSVTLSAHNDSRRALESLAAGAGAVEADGGCGDCAIMSLFPHRGDPTVAGDLFRLLGRRGIRVKGAANSPSAISVIIPEKDLDCAGRDLFKAFSFSAYRTPEDWKAAQKGKEELYKEVVASYQEKRPKVYGLTCGRGQSLIRGRVPCSALEETGTALCSLGRAASSLTLLTSGPGATDGTEHLVFCRPEHQDRTAARPFAAGDIPGAEFAPSLPSGVFFMNGPHFGDRYGIIRDLVCAMEDRGVSPIALNCTVASIVGAVAEEDLDPSVEAVLSCFEVPEVNRI